MSEMIFHNLGIACQSYNEQAVNSSHILWTASIKTYAAREVTKFRILIGDLWYEAYSLCHGDIILTRPFMIVARPESSRFNKC